MTSFFSKKISHLIGSASGWGAQRRETEKGPEWIRSLDFGTEFSSEIPFLWQEIISPLKKSHEISLSLGKETLPFVETQARQVGQAVFQCIQKGGFPVVIGGDHSVAMGSWAGLIQALDAQETFGLIWFDAHMDAHTPQTTPSHAYHGMPVATLMGHGDRPLVDLLIKGSKISPKHLVLMGLRSFEEEESALLHSLGVRLYYMHDIKERGFETVLKEAIDYVSCETKGFGLSIDLDGFDPIDAPGVGSPEPNGIRASEALPLFHLMREHPSFKGLEIVEFNPDRDQDGKTAQLLVNLLKELLPRS